MPACAITSLTWGTRICCRLQSFDAHDQQKGLSCCWNGYLDEIVCTTVITANGEVQTHEEATVCVKQLDLFLTMKVLENTPAVLLLRKFCDEYGYSYEWINGQKPHLIKNGIRIQCNTENLVPIVVPGLSTSSSSSFPSSTSMTPSRQGRNHPTSSSSSSTSPTTTVSSDSETSAREDLCGIDSYPVSVSCEHVERKERRDTLLSKPTKNPKPIKKRKPRHRTGRPGVLGIAARFQRKSRGWQSSSTQRLTREFFSWTIFRACEKCGLGYTQCLYSLPERPTLRDLPEDFQLRMLIRTLWKRVVLICVCGWHKIGWKETKHWSDVETAQ